MHQTDNNPKVSVIIPVYNVEPYLRQCIESILSQTMEEIEIILVDDGSTDGSGQVCEDYSAKDNRIKTIHKSNEGVSAARNDGIIASCAPYIQFVDGDDWVEADFCEAPYAVAIRNSADLVLYTYNKVDCDGHIKKFETNTKEGLLSESEALRFNVYCQSFACGGLYRRELFDSIRFPIGFTFEDVGTTHRLIHAANRISFLNKPIYNYRINRPGSITTSWDNRRHRDVREMLTRKINDLCSWGFEEYARKDALTLTEKYGRKGAEQKPIVEIVNRMKGNAPEDFSQEHTMMLKAFHFSPLLFDLLCVIKRKRIRIQKH